MFRRILVTLDGSEFAEAALPAAAAVARRTGAELRLLAVADPGYALTTESGWAIEGEKQATADTVRSYLRETRDLMAERCPTVTTTLRTGYPADEIVREADEFDADLVVMATHGRGALSRMWLGSVANHCVRHLHRSVLLIRPNGGGKAEALREASLALHRIFVPLDGSAFSERALGAAVGFANLFGSRLTLIRSVFDLTVADPAFFPERVERTEAIVDQEVAAARGYLENLARPLREFGLTVDTEVVPAPEPGAAILDKAAGRLVVIATHARTGVGRALMGSVTEAVVHGAQGPVLVVPPEARPIESPVPGREPFAATVPLVY